ncbi:MAG: hypothetical protein JWP79_2880, partial [Polaromonas sp.]|nr:hypothetical protein [Polaromonas sp.]
MPLPFDPRAPAGLQRPARPGGPGRGPGRLRMAAGLAAGMLFMQQAGAVFVFIPLATRRIVTLQVGSTGGAIDNVSFNVTGANISPTPTAVTGVPSAGTPATTPAGGVRVRLRAQWGSGNSPALLVVSSPAGLTCVGGTGCGGTVIPFNTISWTAYEKSNFTAFDIQDGSFTGAGNQVLTNFSCCGGSDGFEMANTLIFSYT